MLFAFSSNDKSKILWLFLWRKTREFLFISRQKRFLLSLSYLCFARKKWARQIFYRSVVARRDDKKGPIRTPKLTITMVTLLKNMSFPFSSFLDSHAVGSSEILMMPDYDFVLIQICHSHVLLYLLQ